MKILFLQIIISTSLHCHSQSSNYLHPVESPAQITRNMMSWLYYERDHMVWSANYVSLNTTSDTISKENFLQQLMTGNYLPVRIITSDSSFCYQLYVINKSVDKEIGKVISQKAQTEYQYYKMEGQALPDFDFIDLNGNSYNDSSTKGNIIVLNCWFIHCQACIEEMPKLNQLVKQFKNRKDILFIALAFDKADNLNLFLSKKNFQYAIVANKEHYLENDLRIISYPTHLLIDRKGKIVKVIDGSVEELTNTLKKEISK